MKFKLLGSCAKITSHFRTHLRFSAHIAPTDQLLLLIASRFWQDLKLSTKCCLMANITMTSTTSKSARAVLVNNGTESTPFILTRRLLITISARKRKQKDTRRAVGTLGCSGEVFIYESDFMKESLTIICRVQLRRERIRGFCKNG